MVRTVTTDVTRMITRGFAAFVLVLAAGCGDDTAVPDTSAPTTSAAPAASDAVLDIEAGSDELPDTRRASVRAVDGTVEVDGYIDDRDAVARVLTDAAAIGRLVDGPATDVACTEQYGGPDVAHVTGTIDGRAVDTRFDRADGCGIADWELVQPILPLPIWSSAPEATIGDAANPVVSTVGDRLTIRLQANATTGYVWEIELPDWLIVTEDRYEEPAGVDVVGAGGSQVFVIEAVAAGAGVIELVYVQPFDDAGEPAETRTVHVEVVAAS